LSQAGEREREYDWLEAAEFYRKALGLISEQDFLKMGGIYERLGYAFHRAAMQAESVDEFRERMHRGVANYGKAKEFYRRISEPGKTPRLLRCDATIAYMRYWLTSEVPEKKRLLDECWTLAKDALNAFKVAEEALEYGKTYNQLSSSAYHRHVLEWNFESREKIIREAMECGEQSVTLLSDVGDPYQLTRAFVGTAIYLTYFAWYFTPDMNEGEKYRQKGLSYWQKANQLSEETALLELLSIPGEGLDWNTDEELMIYEKALSCARKTKDKFLTGTALDFLAYSCFLKPPAIEDPDERVEIFQRALQYAEEAKHQFSSISFVSSRGGVLWTEAPNSEYYFELALWEPNLQRRRDLLEKAVIDGARAIKLAESAGYPYIISSAHHVLSKALAFLAQTETSSEKKRRLLEKALEHRNESIRIFEQIIPLSYWNRGVIWNYLADLKAELSDFEKDSENRKNMLDEAISHKERSLQLCIKDVLYFEKIGTLSYYAVLGNYQYSHGELLNRLYELTSNHEHQKRAVRSLEEAAESFRKLNLVSRIAECHWKAAKGYNALGEHLKAAENFNLASNNYDLAAEKIPQLKDFYQDHAVYMEAWSEIEKARHHHARQEYASAKEHYQKSAIIHESLKQWRYLAPNYSAWVQVENAEDLSRKEQSEEAIQAFEQAAKLFTETKKSLQKELGKIESADEKQMVTDLIQATDLRCQYCMGRVTLEEAKIFDRKGDHYFSSQKYGSAAETFERISQALESEQDRKEVKFILCLSRAWQKMTRAEAEASPMLYGEASQLFEEAKKFSPNEKAIMLALGHSRFCRALEAGTKFADTRDITLYRVAIQHLESAANYYVKAGFQNASEYAEATELLFDAYVHMDDAKKEKDPEKKARLYVMTEKVLQTSADSYMKAEHIEKSEQVLRMLERVKKERELVMSITEVLHAPSIVATTSAFLAPTPTHEEAVGLEKFENADIQANVRTRQKELEVGDTLDLEIELVNAGKGPALLTKITEVAPEGFEIIEKPDMYRVEDSYLNMKGKQLNPLKTEEVSLVLKPKVRGVFPLKPKILYLDENGKDKSYETKPITITVKELGIKGWLKG